MNTTQKQRLIEAIVAFKKIDFDKLYRKGGKQKESMQEIYIGDFSLSELTATASRAVHQLECALETTNWKYLPFDNVSLDSSGTLTLYDVLDNLVSYFKSAAFDFAVRHVKALVLYEMQNGIWNRDDSFQDEERETRLIELEMRLKGLWSVFQDRKVYLENAIKEVDDRKLEYENILRTYKGGLHRLETTQKEIEHITVRIKHFQDETISKQNTINSLSTRARELCDGLDSSRVDLDSHINICKKCVSDTKKELDDLTNLTLSHMDDVEGQSKKMKEYATEALTLLGYIKDGTLAHSFNNRKMSIQKQVNFWMWLSILGTILLAVWIYVVFTVLNVNIAGPDASKVSGFIVFANLMLNIAKTSPMVVLLWFILAQYKKERHLLEEYAFREAVSLTLSSYLNQLGESQDEHQRELLMKTVERLYTQPIIVGDSSIAISLKSGDILKTVRAVTDATTESKRV